MSEHQDHITVTLGGSGYFAIMLKWYTDIPNCNGYWDVWTSGIGRYATREEAVEEAKDWAEAEELECRV